MFTRSLCPLLTWLARRNGAAARPAGASRTNPRYFAVAHAEGVDEAGLPDGLACQQQLPRRVRFRSKCPEDPERFDFDLPGSALRGVVITSSGSGAGSSFGATWSRVMSRLLHGPATMAPDRAWISQGRPTQVRSVGLRSIRSTSRAGHGGRTCWHLCIRDALRRLQPSSDADARQHRGSTFHAYNNVNDIAITSIVDYRSSSARCQGRGRRADLHPQGDRHCS